MDRLSPGRPVPTHGWVDEFPAAITVCDERGIILAMNDRAAHMFRERGGRALIGSDVLECHPEPARSKLAALMAEQRSNTYSVTTARGKPKMIHQTPWFEGGAYRGFVEIVFDLPGEVPHFVRGGP